VPAVRLGRWLAGFEERHGATTATSDGGEIALLGTDEARAWLTVPFGPLPDPSADPREALVTHALTPRTVGVLLVRRGGWAVGVFDGAELVASKVGSRYVQGATSAGGWSQQRFARRRANQAAALYGDAAEAALRVLLPAAPKLAGLVCGGDRQAVDAVLADPRLAPLAKLRTGELLSVPDPRLKVLQDCAEAISSVTIRLEP
jgi:hypothetical protein